MTAPPPIEPKPPRTRLRRRLAVALLVAATVLAWFVAPNREEWRLSGTWYFAEVLDDGTVMAIHLRWWGGYYATLPGEGTAVAQWWVEDGRLQFRPRVDQSTWATIMHLLKGEPAYEETQSNMYAFGPRGLEVRTSDDDEPVLLCRTREAALREADAFIEPTSAAANQMPVNAAAALYRGRLWQVRCDDRVGLFCIALLEAGPDGVRRLLTSELVSTGDRAYVGCRPGDGLHGPANDGRGPASVRRLGRDDSVSRRGQRAAHRDGCPAPPRPCGPPRRRRRPAAIGHAGQPKRRAVR